VNIQGAKATVSPLGDLANRLTARIRARRERRRLTALLELDDHILCRYRPHRRRCDPKAFAAPV
jgi:hypothetical protein